MLSDISDRLTRAIEKKRLKGKIERNLAQAELDLAESTWRLNELKQKLHKERVDVEKLERTSLSSLFYSALGSREEQVEKERQELLAAQVKYQQVKKAVEVLQADRSHLEKQLEDLRETEGEYASLLGQKESLLRQANPQVAGELVRLSEEIAARNAEKREIDEAAFAAAAVLACLEKVIGSLESAEGWGTWDLLGGGFLSTAIKHSRIDEARNGVNEVQARLIRFSRELADVQRSANLQIDISDLDVFADFFFDGLIMDWIVQSKIQESLHQTRMVKDKIGGMVDELARLGAEALKQAQRLEQQRFALIEQG